MQTLLIVLTLSHFRALHDALRETFLKVTNNENDIETSFRRALVLDRELWIETKKKNKNVLSSVESRLLGDEFRCQRRRCCYSTFSFGI